MTSHKSIGERLMKLVKGRESAYNHAKKKHGHLSLQKLRCISSIRNSLSPYLHRSEVVQSKIIVRIKDKILILLPSSYSRYSKVRAEMLDIIQEAKANTLSEHNYQPINPITP